MKTVSVVIAAYRAQDFLGDAVDSVFAQSLPKGWRLELIVGIDGCPQTWEAATRLRPGNGKVIRMRERYGPYVTFNTLAGYAVGDVIARFDADDIMLDGYLRQQLWILEHNPAVHLTRTWSLYTNMDLSPHSARVSNGSPLPDGRRQAGCDGALVFRRSVWEMLGGFRPWRCFADTDFIIRAFYLGFHLFEIEDYLFVRRFHPDSLTQSSATREHSRIRDKYQRIMDKEKWNYLTPSRCHLPAVTGTVAQVASLGVNKKYQPV